MFFFQGTSEPTGYEKIVARLAASARYRAPLFNKSNYTHGNGDWPWRAARLAADYADLKPLRSPAQPAIKLFHSADASLLSNQRPAHSFPEKNARLPQRSQFLVQESCRDSPFRPQSNHRPRLQQPILRAGDGTKADREAGLRADHEVSWRKNLRKRKSS